MTHRLTSALDSRPTALGRHWRRAGRWLIGVPFGLVAIGGLGCHSSQHVIVPPSQSPVAVGRPSPAPDRPAATLGPIQIVRAVDSSEEPKAPSLLPTGMAERAQVEEEPSQSRSEGTTGAGPSPRQGDGGDTVQPASTIDLGIALRLAGVDNPTINLAREQVREALANQLAADSLLLPTVNVGGNFDLHNGPVQASNGFIRDVDRRSAYAGFGARTLAAETIGFPGIRLFAHLGDAVYEPLAARQRVQSRQSDAAAVQNAVLLDVTTAYLSLVGAEAQQSILREGQTRLQEVSRVTDIYAKAGEGRQGEAQRVAANVANLNRTLAFAAENIAVASARLNRLLSLEGTSRLQSPGGPIEAVRLIPEDTDLEVLVAAAVRSRPELLARSAAVQEAQIRVRQEQVRPWVPTLSVGYSAGVFGGGGSQATTDFSPFFGRSDFDVIAVWNLQNLWVGNRARTAQADAVVGQAIAELRVMNNQVRREVSEALAAARAAAKQMEAARRSLRPAEEGFRQEIDRVHQGQGRPIELLDSFRQYLEARQEMIRTTVAYDIAQFRLYVAVGRDPLAGVGTNPGDPDCAASRFECVSPAAAGCSVFGINRE
jgi:outer membrane protein TolC